MIQKRGFLGQKVFSFKVLVDIFLLKSGSVDLNIFVDPDPDTNKYYGSTKS